MNKHISIAIARREGVNGFFDLDGRWQGVPQGPLVADELTRNLREPYRSMIRDQYADQRRNGALDAESFR